jgi:hypothetical protein
MRTFNLFKSRVVQWPSGRASAIWVTEPEFKLSLNANSQFIQRRNFLYPELTAYSVLKWCYRPDQVSIKSAPRTTPSYDSLRSVPILELRWVPKVTNPKAPASQSFAMSVT